MADTFERNSSSKNYTNEFQTFKTQAEKENINFKSNNNEEYNTLFTIEDLSESIKNS